MHNIIILKNRNPEDRLGANIFSYILQIIIAHHYDCYIEYTILKYEDSIFIKTIIDFLEIYNNNKLKGDKTTFQSLTNGYIKDVNETYVTLGYIVNNIIKTDIFTYFKIHFNNYFNSILKNKILEKNYILQFDPKKTILIHLRLDDLNKNNSVDFNGQLISDYFSNLLNNNFFDSSNIDNNSNYLKNKIISEFYKYLMKNKKYTNNISRKLLLQSIIDETKIKLLIDKIQKKYTDHEIILLSSPIGEINLPYKCIRSDDIDYDLYCLCSCEKIVLSRSCFALSSLFFSNATDVWIPNWSISCLSGLNSKYDKTDFLYFN